MNDRELVEFAARAIGYEYVQPLYSKDLVFSTHEIMLPTGEFKSWNPLTDDGDALRLAVKLEMEVYFGDDGGTPTVSAGIVVAQNRPIRFYSDPVGNDPYAATRRAIVRAAAEIGKIKGNEA